MGKNDRERYRKNANTRDDVVVASRAARRANDEDASPNARGRARKQTKSERATVWAILTFVVVRFYIRWLKFSERRFVTTAEDDALAVIRDGFLSPWEFDAFKKCALEHPKLRVKNGLTNSGFSKTRGFVVKFNNEGVREFKEKEDYSCFAGMFDTLRLPDANAFVMNILLCELGDHDQYNSDEVSVGLHLDTTVGIYSRHLHVAHQVSVLYASVPPDMRGGELELFPYNDGDPVLGAFPEKVITPKENTLVTFRGDAFHQVKSYSTRTGKERVSLVLEQYKIDDVRYGKTIRFIEHFKSNMTTM